MEFENIRCFLDIYLFYYIHNNILKLYLCRFFVKGSATLFNRDMQLFEMLGFIISFIWILSNI